MRKKRRSRAWWLTVALVVVIGVVAGLAYQIGRGFGRFTRDANWMIHVNGVAVSPYHNSDSGAHAKSAGRLLEGRYTLKAGQSLAISLPIGDLTVRTGSSPQVLVSVRVSGQPATVDKAQAYVRKTLLMPSTDSQLFALGLGLPGLGGSLSGVHMTVTLPADLQVILEDHLGTVRVAGSYRSLTVFNHVGNIYITAAVKRALYVSDNLGNEQIVLHPGSLTRVSDSMGNIDLTITSSQRWHIAAGTTLGEVVNDAKGRLVVSTLRDSEAIRSSVVVQDDLGSITLR